MRKLPYDGSSRPVPTNSSVTGTDGVAGMAAYSMRFTIDNSQDKPSVIIVVYYVHHQ